MHVTESVFLKKSPISESEFVYELWSREFGKIRAFTKEKKIESKLDVGSLFQATIDTKGNTNRLVSCKLRRNLSTESLDYTSTLGFLKIVDTLSRSLPEGVPNIPLFDEFTICHPFFERTVDGRKTGIFFLLKLAKTLGTFETPKDASDLFRRLEKAIVLYEVPKLLEIRGMSDALVSEAEFASGKAFNRYHA